MNKACVKLDNLGKPIRPFQVINALSDNVCPVNSIPFYKAIDMKGHNGYDFMAYHGEPVYHSGDYDGFMKTEVDQDGGIGVRVVSNQPLINGKHVQLIYWHLKSVVGHDTKEIKKGDLIGYADNTGSSSGDHLHFALKLCDKKGKTLNSGNGYAGAIDHTPYYENSFIGDVVRLTQTLTLLQQLSKALLMFKSLTSTRH